MQTTRLTTILLVSFLFSATTDPLAAQTITHVPLYTFHGDFQFDALGYSVSGAGDINGDGIDDFIVGALGGDTNDGGYARVFVSQVLGDCNQDGVVDSLDNLPFLEILFAGDFLGQADTNEDGVVSFLDIQPLIDLLSSQ